MNSVLKMTRTIEQRPWVDRRQVKHERRRSPRVDVLSRVEGELVAFNLPVTIVNVSRSGFLMHGPVLLPAGTVAHFRFTMTDHEPVLIHARVVRVMATTAGDHTTYMIGLSVLSDHDDAGLDTIVAALEGL